MENSYQILRTLEQLLDREIELYVKYRLVVDEERSFVSKINTEKLAELTVERSRLCDLMAQAQERRRDLIKEWSGDGRIKLTDFIKAHFSPQEAARVLAKAETLKGLVRECQARSSEFNQVVGFSLNVVSGLMSILWSATQNIVHSYTPLGKMKESYHPSAGRAQSVLKKA